MIEILFILGFTLHNIEEAIWLPGWSKYAKKYHKEVTNNEFHFAVIIITAIGYLITFQYLIDLPTQSFLSKYMYLGFILMMVLNVIFPHIISTIVLRRYAPGTLTGLLLNAPIGTYILIKGTTNRSDLIYTFIAGGIVTVIILLLINVLFKLGKVLFD